MSKKTDIAQGSRARVRTPGKYIVLAVAAVGCAGVAGTSVIKQAGPVLARAELPSLTTKKVGRKTHVELPDYLVDLSPDRRGRVAYLKLSASLVFDDGKNPQSLIQFADLEPFVSERTVMLLRTLRPEDFQGSEKISFLKAEMLRRANLVLGVNGAEDVVIRSLVIQ